MSHLPIKIVPYLIPKKFSVPSAPHGAHHRAKLKKWVKHNIMSYLPDHLMETSNTLCLPESQSFTTSYVAWVSICWLYSTAKDGVRTYTEKSPVNKLSFSQ